MKTKIIITAFILPLLSAAISNGTEKVPDKTKTIKEVLEKSGIDRQAKEIPNIVKVLVPSHLSAYRADGHEALTAYIENNLDKHFSADEMLKTISNELDKNFDGPKMETLLKWFNSETGKKITDLEVRATTPDTALAIMAYTYQIQVKPPPENRLKLINDLIKTLDLEEHSSKKTGAIFMEMARGMNAGLPENRRIPEDTITQMKTYMQKSMSRQNSSYIVATLLYTYSSLTDQELKSYVDFLATGPAKWFSEIYLAAFITSLEKSSFSFGQALGKEIAKTTHPPAEKKLQWQKYTAEDGAFTLDFPGKPQKGQEIINTESGNITMHTLVFETESMAFVITWVADYPPLVNKTVPLKELMNSMVEGSASNVGGQIVDTVYITYQDFPGIDYKVTIMGSYGLIHSKVIFVGGKYYQMMITGSVSDVIAKENQKFFETLKIKTADQKAE